MRRTVRGLFAAAILISGLAAPRFAGAQATVVSAVAPFVDLSLLGSDVIVRPDRIRYRVSADPATYVTVILISPRGHRTVLNPYEKAVEGTRRRELVRETVIGFESGESYIVALATRSRLHSLNLVRQTQSTAQLASSHFSAEGSLDELLTSIAPSAGDDFSAAYVSFRVLPRDLPILQYSQRCPVSYQVASNGLITDGLYRGLWISSPFYSDFADQARYISFLDQPYFASSCQNRLIVPPLLVARGPNPVLPIPPADTSVIGIDSATHSIPRPHPIATDPPAPLPLDFVPSNNPIGRATQPLPVSRTPDLPPLQPIPVQAERREPVMPVPMAPRIDPVMPVQREPIAQPPVPLEPRTVPMQPIAPPPPPPPPPPRSEPTPLPPATGTTPAIPPPN